MGYYGACRMPEPQQGVEKRRCGSTAATIKRRNLLVRSDLQNKYFVLLMLEKTRTAQGRLFSPAQNRDRASHCDARFATA
jgi:hypothetical protein